VEGQTHTEQDLQFAGDVHRDSQHALQGPSTSTPFSLDFTTLSQVEIVSHGHFDRPPYTTKPHVPIPDSDDIEPPEDNLGDDAGVAHDTYTDDAARQ
jgi:hypothetical protein